MDSRRGAHRLWGLNGESSHGCTVSDTPGSVQMLFFFFNLFLNWRKFALQCSVGFRPTTMQISSNYTCITSLWSLPPFPHATRLGHRRAPGWPPRITQQLLASRLSDTGECADGDAAFCRRPPSPCPSVSTSPLSVWGSIPFLHVGSSVPLFSILYISSNSPLRLCF